MVCRSQKGFQIIVSPDLSFENWPTCTAYIVRVCGCACVSVHIYVCPYERAPSPQIKKNNKKNTIIRMPRSLPFIPPGKKKERVYKNLFAKGHTRQSNTSLFHFHFAPPSSSPASLSHHYLPAPSVFLQSISHQTNRACLAFQSSRGEQLSACHILSEFSPSFRGKETELQWNHGAVDSQPLNNNDLKKEKVWRVLLSTCFHRFQVFGEYFGRCLSPQICHRAEEHFWVT